MSFLLIPHLCSQAANIHTCSFLLGGPPILPAYFFSHALGRRVSARPSKFALIVHSIVPKGQFLKDYFSPEQRRGGSYTFGDSLRDYSGSKPKPNALSLQPTATGDMEVSVIIEVEGLRSLQAVADFLFTGRFAGGSIQKFRPPQLFEDLDQAVTSVGSGYGMRDRSELLKPQDGKNQAQLLVSALGQRADKSGDTSWLAGACLGYATITDFAERSGSREGYSHAFAEPLIGLVQYRSLRSIGDNMKALLWNAEWLGDEIFRVYQD